MIRYLTELDYMRQYIDIKHGKENENCHCKKLINVVFIPQMKTQICSRSNMSYEICLWILENGLTSYMPTKLYLSPSILYLKLWNLNVFNIFSIKQHLTSSCLVDKLCINRVVQKSKKFLSNYVSSESWMHFLCRFQKYKFFYNRMSSSLPSF